MENNRNEGKSNFEPETAPAGGTEERSQYVQGGPGGAREGRAGDNPAGGSEEVLSNSQAGEAMAKGTGQPEKPIEVMPEPSDVNKVPGVPGGMSGLKNMDVDRSETWAGEESPKEKGVIGGKKGKPPDTK